MTASPAVCAFGTTVVRPGIGINREAPQDWRRGFPTRPIRDSLATRRPRLWTRVYNRHDLVFQKKPGWQAITRSQRLPDATMVQPGEHDDFAAVRRHDEIRPGRMVTPSH